MLRMALDAVYFAIGWIAVFIPLFGRRDRRHHVCGVQREMGGDATFKQMFAVVRTPVISLLGSSSPDR